ncbi:M16 family metallopeptidase [Luteimonas sp. JM171]|uniref:M16 family metallopeptidase n=1 Tax=Luteimonas sp. JM171 TaxID=1896164 RepID=UPI003C2D8EA8
MTSLTFTGERGELEEYRVLQNGLTVLLAPTAPAAAVLVMVTYHAGSGDEGADAEGCSHMLEHMMFKGSARYNRSLGTSIHDKIGAVGGSTNATTWRDYTNYWCFVPSRHLELAIDIEADRMQAPLLARSDLDVERKVVLNEQDIRASSPMEFISDVVWRTMYPNHAYGRPVIGSRSAISNLSRDQLLHHHKSFYQTNNATITVAGHFDREEAKDQIGLLFGGIPPADPASRSAATPIASIRAHETTVYQQGAPECLAVVFPSPPAYTAIATHWRSWRSFSRAETLPALTGHWWLLGAQPTFGP